MNEDRARDLGELLIRILYLKVIKSGDDEDRVNTLWGTKTATGLGRLVNCLIDERDYE